MHQLSQNRIKFFSTLCVGTLSILLVLLLSNIVTKRTLKNTEKRYYESCEQVLSGYSQSIRWYLENYYTSLDTLYNKEIFESGNNAEIQKWLMENTRFVHEDFCITYFVDTSGIGYFSQGQIEDLSDRSYITTKIDSKTSYYVSDIIVTPFADYPIFLIQELIFNDEGTYLGMLCGAIKVYKLEPILDIIKIGKKKSFCIMDRNGRFLVHPEKEYIGNTYIPKNPSLAHISSEVIANSKEGMTITEDINGKPIYLFYTKIDECGWTLGLTFPKSDYYSIYSNYNKIKVFIVIFAMLVLLGLITLEMIIVDNCYKKQIIQADYDPLTKMWTRQRFENEASKLIKHNHAKYMLIESDIRGFKFINQNFGEETADGIIFFYSKLLNEFTREYNGIIGRGFADHFYSLIKITEVRKAMSVFKEAMAQLTDEIKKYDVQFFPKFGITFYMPRANNNITIQNLIGQASFAKSTIKDNMMTQYAIYNSRLLDQINKERFIEVEMENALENKEFFVMYQPKIDLTTDKVVGAEALVRWYNKEMGLLTPDKFIPLFERNGFITKLDFYVYEQVFQFLEKQIADNKAVVPISMNMSRNHSKPDRFMHDFLTLFGKYKIPSTLIQLEILERSVMDSSTLQEITEMLHKEGFSVAMDDFGSGESSLNMLTKVPVDVLKFDRAFLLSSTNDNGAIDQKSARFIEILIELSKHLEKETVFEGVETQAQRDFLRSIRCDQAQGYFYSKPLSEQDFVEFIRLHS